MRSKTQNKKVVRNMETIYKKAMNAQNFVIALLAIDTQIRVLGLYPKKKGRKGE